MPDVPDLATYGLFEDEDDDQRTVVDTSFFDQPKVPDYPPLAYFGRFEILGRIARGGMAEVYLAREWDPEGKARHIVVKRVLPEMEDNAELRQMFLEEGRVAVRLYHPNVCHVYECGEVEGVTFMALEWVWGCSLQDVIERATERGVTLPWPVAVDLVSQVAAALHYVHHAKGLGGKPLGIVHRDVSPHNVMLSWTGAVKLLDFGIAKTSQDGGDGGSVGKYGYMSPEQAQSRPVDPRSDIFALGIVLYEALTGRPLYDRPTLLDTLSAIVREPVPSVRSVDPELPEALDQILRRALAKDPAARFQSAGELKAALGSVLRSSGQMVSERRVAMLLEKLFDAEERAPLPPERSELTSSFAALTAEGAVTPGGAQEVTYETFAHDGSSSIQPMPEVTAAPRGASVWQWVAFIGFALVLGSAAAALTLWLL